jgi:DNA-binding NtrC family response regulator
VTETRAPMSLRDLLRQHERLIIVRTLQSCGFSRSRTALVLQLSRTQLWRRMRALHMELSVLPVVLTGRPRRKS